MLSDSETLQALCGGSVDCRDTTSLGGGCISQAYRCNVLKTNGEQEVWFWKRNQASFLANFQCEATGLKLLAASPSMRTANVIAVGQANGQSHLILSWLARQSTPSDDSFAHFGRCLATHHHQTLGDRIGLDHDNYLGASVQANQWSTNRSWVDFVIERRFEPQIKMARDRNCFTSRLTSACDELIRRMSDILSGREDQTSLLHGDLWSGNCWVDEAGEPVWIDPAVHFGCREAEFGILFLFGGFPHSFFDAYQDEFEMAAGWHRRTSVYSVYHLLNHLNLFGQAYADSALNSIEDILRD